MNTIGLIGGTSWLSTKEYYQLINEQTNDKLGGSFSARCLVHSFNFQEILSLQEKDDDEAIYKLIKNASENLVRSGADGIALCANTMHKYADRLKQETEITIVHIAEATGSEIKRLGYTKAGLLGTKYTMELDFYTSVLERIGITTVIPNNADRQYVNQVIYDELVNDLFKEESRRGYLNVIDRLKQQGAQGIVLGCTEIPLLINQNHTEVPLFNTLNIHANAIVDFILK